MAMKSKESVRVTASKEEARFLWPAIHPIAEMERIFDRLLNQGRLSSWRRRDASRLSFFYAYNPSCLSSRYRSMFFVHHTLSLLAIGPDRTMTRTERCLDYECYSPNTENTGAMGVSTFSVCQRNALYSTHQQQDEYDQQHYSEQTGGTITPPPTIRPRWDCTNQHQNQND
jgi:hypothetical protein